ncbi:hypothetical protein Syun_007130 [Stephania yunnanensis]|uniref:Uncharacterized protein n=1 Tax=Stephania yunnanensis TaxID=152371 RepID=A0AAP0KZP5_9MAGN
MLTWRHHPSLWGVSKSKPNTFVASAHHLLHGTAPPKPSIIFVLRHCASPPALVIAFRIRSLSCSPPAARRHRARPLALLSSSSSAIALSLLRLLVVAARLRHLGLLLGLSTSPRTPVASLPRGARPIARPFSSPALPSPLSCFRPIIPPNPITANETYASASQPLPARYACGETPLGQHNPITINASASQPLPALLSMMDSSQPIPRISPKSRVKIPIVRGRGDRRGGRGGRGVSRTMHQ